ncbi:hypothetical protein B296_00001863 [Ensete ventricosum]|uniref:Expansin-like EG45 domain-containing protein n=1 Tax=Ensete ventricosum TaxID=4639 RepID=A0A427AUI4_ENSVE|nr:hypothetical protein B296_00001863 [Ensete ventricosum]
MALPTQLLFLLPLVQHRPRADTCSDCFIQSRAAYYPILIKQAQRVRSKHLHETCFQSGATLNDGYVSASSSFYRNGVGGACYQVRCTDAKHCPNDGVMIIITYSGASSNTYFLVSMPLQSSQHRVPDLGASLVSLGAVSIEYRRVSCSYPIKNITFKIDQSSNHPSYFALQIWYHQGNKDVTAILLLQTENLTCKLLERSHVAMWAVVPPPSGPLSVRMLLSGGDDGDETWVVPPNNIPQNWTSGATYDSGIQV